jgi:hypothetical protein
MAYTTIDKPDEYFNTVLYTGNETITNIDVGFQPSFVWIKRRNSTQVHALFDQVRGVAIGALQSNSTDTENANQKLVAYTSDGFTLPDTNFEWTNSSGDTFVSWNWLGNGAGVSNSDGTISSTVSASTTSGFSIVSYTGNATGGATVGHGLGVVPKMIIIKIRSGVGGVQWVVYHVSTGNTQALYLNTTATPTATSGFFNNTTPSSTFFTLGTDTATNSSGNPLIAYCFADVKGFSKFGSYTGNNSSDGPFIYTGFKPAWVLFKRSSSNENWSLYDNKRLGYNPQAYGLRPNIDLPESTYGAGGAAGAVDFVSNGFKIRESGTNINSGTYIYMAFAENPFVTSTGIPTTAR